MRSFILTGLTVGFFALAVYATLGLINGWVFPSRALWFIVALSAVRLSRLSLTMALHWDTIAAEMAARHK